MGQVFALVRGWRRGGDSLAMAVAKCGRVCSLCGMRIIVLVLAAGLLSGCLRVRVDPIQIEPIYIEVTINHRIQRDLEDFFADLDRESAAMDYKPLEELMEENQ